MLGKATSAFHAESERLGRQTLDRMTDQRTTIVIAHRLAIAQRRTVFLKNGHGVAGLHSDLTQDTSMPRLQPCNSGAIMEIDGKAASLSAPERA